MTGDIYIKNNPKISHEIVDFIASRFVKKIVNPTTDINTIMYDAGQQSVITYLRGIASGNLPGDVDININRIVNRE
jgi:hypothetical protein